MRMRLLLPEKSYKGHMRVLLVLIVLLCSSHFRGSCSIRYLEPWRCDTQSDYSCIIQDDEITLVCSVQISERSSTHNIRWFRSRTRDWEVGRTFYNGTSKTVVTELEGQTVISSEVTVPRSSVGYWWCGVTESEDVLFCPEMATVHIFQCACETELAVCPSLLNTCNRMDSAAQCSPSSRTSFCLVNSIVEQTLSRSSDSIPDTKPTIRVPSPRSSKCLSETKTIMTRSWLSYVSTTTAMATPHTSPKGGDNTAILKLLLVVVGMTVAVIGVVVVVVFIACFFRITRAKHHKNRTDTEEHIYDTVKIDTLIRSTTADERYKPKLFSQVSTATAADYEEPITTLRTAGHKRPQMESVNPVCLEMYGSTEDGASNDQTMNDS